MTQPTSEHPTGRLFRVAGVAAELAPEAVPVPERRRAERDATLAAVASYAFGDPDVGDPDARDPDPDESHPHDPAPDGDPRDVQVPSDAARERRDSGGLTLAGAWLVVLGTTIIMGFADAVVRDMSLGWLTGVGLVASTVYAAAAARRSIMRWTVVIPPLSALAAALTAGQLTLGGSGPLLAREAFMVFATLTSTAWWTLGASLAALVIVLIRRRRPG